jgi:hypothetical protein
MVIFSLLSGPDASAQLATYHFTADNLDVTTNVPLNEINTRAFRNFINTYGFVSAAVWRKGKEGFAVRWFGADSIEYIVHYTPRGRLADTRIYYSSQNAPLEVRTLMGRLYPGYDLLYVSELADSAYPLYEVGLANNGLTLIVDVQDKEVRVKQDWIVHR